MKLHKSIFILFFTLTLIFFLTNILQAGTPGATQYTFPNTDAPESGPFPTQSLFYFFDLRDRETYIQLTFPDFDRENDNAIAHVQIFDVNNNCNENDFFDSYTPNDTHVYNLRNIITNDGNLSGVILPDDSYGIVVITLLALNDGFPEDAGFPFGNQRILDNKGYEYRTNAQSIGLGESVPTIPGLFYSFNFNQQGGINFSDIIGMTLWPVQSNTQFNFEWTAVPVQGTFSPFDIDIYDLNETPFSCRDIIFSCVNQENTLIEELLEIAQTANVASFEYGINDAIPHSRDGELLCPGNTISEGTVLLRSEPYPDTDAFRDIIDNINPEDPPVFLGYVGLNNGNGRGSMDSFWVFNEFKLFR